MIPDQNFEDVKEKFETFLPGDEVINKITMEVKNVNSAHYLSENGMPMFSVFGEFEKYLESDFKLVHRHIYRPYKLNVAICKCGEIYTTGADLIIGNSIIQ